MINIFKKYNTLKNRRKFGWVAFVMGFAVSPVLASNNFIPPADGIYNYEKIETMSSYSDLVSKQTELILNGASVENFNGGLSGNGNIFPSSEAYISVNFSPVVNTGIRQSGLTHSNCPAFNGPQGNHYLNNPYIAVSYVWAHNQGLGRRNDNSIIKKDCLSRQVTLYYLEQNANGELSCLQQFANTQACFKY